MSIHVTKMGLISSMDLSHNLKLDVLNFVADTFIYVCSCMQTRIIDIFIRTVYLQLTIGPIQKVFNERSQI